MTQTTDEVFDILTQAEKVMRDTRRALAGRHYAEGPVWQGLRDDWASAVRVWADACKLAGLPRLEIVSE